MSDNALVDLSMDFAVYIVTVCNDIKGKSPLVNQLLRSGTSIGANIHEGNYAQSKDIIYNEICPLGQVKYAYANEMLTHEMSLGEFRGSF